MDEIGLPAVLHWSGEITPVDENGNAPACRCPSFEHNCVLQDESEGISDELLTMFREGELPAGFVEDGPFIGIRCERGWWYYELLGAPTGRSPGCFTRWRRVEAQNGRGTQ